MPTCSGGAGPGSHSSLQQWENGALRCDENWGSGGTQLKPSHVEKSRPKF